ncbi:MAG TPA: hypothetical protein PKJ97_02060 [Candidatus Bilamarchaeaceae archaeon]|nr:hypothetical protein [Candidatus Bilamarchaeaceae archaeon]
MIAMAEKKIPRGIPSSESLYFPAHNAEEFRPFQDSNESLTRNLWRMEDVVNVVFSRKFQPTYYEIAVKFLGALSAKPHMDGADIGRFVSENNVSKATFYNRVLPRLRRVGMIKVERETVVAVESRRKFRPMRISMSKTFGNCFYKIGDSWIAVVDEARMKK